MRTVRPPGAMTMVTPAKLIHLQIGSAQAIAASAAVTTIHVSRSPHSASGARNVLNMIGGSSLFVKAKIRVPLASPVPVCQLYSAKTLAEPVAHNADDQSYRCFVNP